MRLGVLVNELQGIGPRQSTAMLISALHGQGHDVRVFGVADLGMDEHGAVVALARGLGPQVTSADAAVEALATATPTWLRLEELGGVIGRVNPARDARQEMHSEALQLLQLAHDRGVVVLNRPQGLVRGASKAYLGLFPAFTRPRTITSANRRDLHRFVLELDGPAVLKPARGTRGVGVFRADPGERNLNQILDLLLERGGMVIAQEFVPRADEGDTRVLVVGGSILRVGGAAATIRRVPAEDDFRSNIHAGGRPVPGVLTPAMERVVEAVGPRLVEDGLFLVGLDFIGDVLCEANVHSAGGLFDLERFTGQPFTEALARAMVEQIERERSAN
ncbi:ATP-grasp domain-containing protein [Paraliomyxa miuraensis]|uniref:hypothetical protein n=1 Tax=Paraliomyxa miuraensis TaxID=376150 RepID=UPI002259B799|nr:hypothetical protein [Paraliomyxa miuraensis]MCX4240626.1 hypothetical protein [Paraliomyxa miuraensis]